MSATNETNETEAEFLARLERIGKDWRYSDEFIGIIVRNRFPRDYSTVNTPAAIPAVGPSEADRGHGDQA
jgi:hypothetical protein